MGVADFNIDGESVSCMKILVTGGAGYIGSHMVRMLDELGHAVVTFDDLSAGFRDAVLGGEFVQGSLHDNAVFLL